MNSQFLNRKFKGYLPYGDSGRIQNQMLDSEVNIPLSRFIEMKEVDFGEELSNYTEFNIIQIGAGGTGGYLTRDLSRFIYSLNQREANIKINYTIVDGDKVEEKNLLRQNFLPQDLGKNKAEAMALRHSRAFGLPITAVTEMFTKHHYSNLRNNSSSAVTILIGCVDSNAARRAMHECMVHDRRPVVWIDSGNERFSGQIVMGYYKDASSVYVPNVIDVYPDLLDPSKDSKSEISCAERLMRDEQNIFVNVCASTHILNFVRQVILKEKTRIHGVIFGINGKVDSMYLKNNTVESDETPW